ncbi:MAG: AmmeMemoRadiSam system protein B [Desulfobacterota bacterium]|nr:AmmeMemoRadiSam system protein B [Thermodesulfobacteriota bacterium]MDW8002285.1 AmmeMemoRadiSam system protein B [Deltaproteobacteria bacterium]
MGYIREPSVSGSFYPDNPSTLKKTIERYLENARIEKIEGDVVGIVSPHAGYMYSGQVAAYGFKAILGKRYDTVVIIAPSHRLYFQKIAIMDRGGYRTPFGVVSVDEELAEKILSSNMRVFESNYEAHLGEHSLEVQIPFLQVVLKEFKIVPMIMGAQRREIWTEAKDSIFSALKGETKKVLFLASTDLSHYYPYEKALMLDKIVVRHIESFDVEGIQKDFESETYEACGGGPMITVMLLSQMFGATKGLVLKYANSGDVSGDKSAVVGYLSAVFVR